MGTHTKEEERAARLKEEATVSMTVQIPVSIHTRMKVAAAERHIGLYEMVIQNFDESF